MAASTVQTDVWSRARVAWRALAAMPLIQSGMSLVVSSIVTSGLGFVFWIVAARRFSSADLGIGSAVITVMILLTDISHVGLKTGLVRFLPIAGSDTRRLIVNAYVLAVAIGALGAIVFLAGMNLWTPDLLVLRESLLTSALFVLATVFWVVFLLEDSVLLGLRLARWVPVENGVFGLLKIILLFPLASLAAELGVFLAWVVPVFAVVAVVNLAVRRTLRRRPQALAVDGRVAGGDELAAEGRRGIVMRDVLSYSLVDWAASTSRTAVIGILPLLVLAGLGSTQSAYYFLAWTITYSVYILSANIGDALVAEASYDEDNVDRHTLHSGLLSMAISVPIVLVALGAAPLVLGAFGREYADQATPVLRLLLLGAIPNVVTRTFVGRLRAQRRMKAVFVYEFALSVSVLVLGWILLGPLGIAGLGVAWLAMLTVAALYVVAVESVWWWAPRIDGRLVRAVTTVVKPLRRIGLRLPSPSLDGQVRATLRGRYSTRPRWRRVTADADLQTVVVRGHEGRPPLRLDLARTEWGNELLLRRMTAAAGLGDHIGLARLRAIVPFPIDHDRSGEQHALIESAISGERGDSFGPDVVESRAMSVLDAIVELHEATAGCLSFDEEAIDHWIRRPLDHLRDAGRVSAGELRTIERILSDGFRRASVPSARIHGNLTLRNALFDPSGKLTGLINWEWSAIGPAFLDRTSLALSELSVQSGEDLGHLVKRLLEQPAPLVDHPALMGSTLPSIDIEAIVWFTWLHQLVPMLRSASGSQTGRFWLARTVVPALERPTVAGSVPA